MSTFAPTTKAQLQTAVNAWVSNATTATSTYGDINTWNVSAITDMSSLFYGRSTFNSNISSWNVSNVTSMDSMFYNAYAFNQPLDLWDVSNVTNLQLMFAGAGAYNQSLASWVVSSSTNIYGMFYLAGFMNAMGAAATPQHSYFNQVAVPTGPVLEPVAFVLPQLNASYELSQALSIIGDYTAPDAYAFPTITLSMPASQFNDGLFQLELVDSNIHTLVNPATEAVYYSEKIIYYADQDKLPLLKDTANVLLKALPVVNGAAVKPLRQRPGALYQCLSESMVHELAYQATGVSLMDDQIDNGAALKASIDDYLTVALPAFVRLQLANSNGKTQNISGASDLISRANVSRELFMQIVESVVGGVNPVTGTVKSTRLNSLFDGSNLVGGKYGIKFIAGDTLRFSITIAPHSVGGVVEDIDYIVDGVQHVKQEARTVELVITMV